MEAGDSVSGVHAIDVIGARIAPALHPEENVQVTDGHQ
jgi:hypothetical protein